MSKLELILLGRFECLLPTGTRISLPMRKAEVLLAFLALSPGLRHPRERLINLLWSDRGEAQARNSLRQCLSAIRKALGEAADLVLLIDRTTVSLKAEMIEVDAIEFERLALAGDFESLTTAAELYQGEFLEGISIRDAACQEWLDGERGRFKRQFVEILSNVAETQLVSHDFAHAIRSAEHLVKQDPLGEHGWRLLMRAYADGGDRSHALQAFKRCRQVLRDELEVEPEAATIELRDRIAVGRTSSAPAPVKAPAAPPEAADSIPASTDHSIAVLPFDNLSGDPAQEYFTDGITESIILNLSLFPGLQVKSRNSSFAFKQKLKGLSDISRELEAAYLVEGSIRKSEDRVRITVQLFDADSSNQVWGKRYDAELGDLFALEEDLSRRIAATVTGQIESDLQRIAITREAADQRAYDLLLAGRYHLQLATSRDNEIAIEKFNRCVEQDPGNARAHAYLYYCHEMNVMDRWARDVEKSRELAARHIREAVSLDPDSALVRVTYAHHLIFEHRYEEARRQLQKVLADNPNDSEALATLAVDLSSEGKPEAAMEKAELALRLDPYHPWAGWILAEAQFFRGRYEDCLATIADTANAPGFIQIYNVAANVELGRFDAARTALEDYLRYCRESMISMPKSVGDWLEYYRDNAPFADRSTNDRIIECLLHAGLRDETGEAQSELPSIAVLPFENMSGDPEQDYFSDGITSDIIATLSRFRRMRTVSRYSTLKYKTEKLSIAEIAAEQKVRYLLEGHVRKSGDRIRVSAELIDASDGNMLWNERYDRDLDDLFAVQDEITRQIALAMKVQFDDGEMARSRAAGTRDIRAWELASAAADLEDTYIRQNILDARELANRALERDPDYAFAWVVLGWTYWEEAFTGWSPSLEDSIRQAEQTNRKALDLDPAYAEAWGQAGIIRLMNHDGEAALEHCARAVEIEPGNAEMHALLAFASAFNEDYEQVRRQTGIVVELCPVRANWYFLAPAQAEKISGDLDRAAEIYRQGIDVEPDSPLCRFLLIDVLLDQGDTARAQRLADEIRALDATMSGRGIVRTYSRNARLRDALQANLAKFDLI